MDRDIETLFEEFENMINIEWIQEKVSNLKQKTLQAIATARAEALREAAEKGWDWIKKNCENELLIGDSFVNAIRSDKQEGQ